MKCRHTSIRSMRGTGAKDVLIKALVINLISYAFIIVLVLLGR